MAIHTPFDRPRSHPKALEALMGRAYADTRLTAQQKAVLICLAWHAKNPLGEAFPAQSTISQLTGVCVSLVGRAIRDLAKLGYIEKKDRKRKDGGNTSCLISIHGMQYYPVDSEAIAQHQATKKPVEHGQRQTVTHQLACVSRTAPLSTTYQARKQESLNQDSSNTAHNQLCSDSADEDETSKSQKATEAENLIRRLKTTATTTKTLMAHLMANHQDLREQDKAAILAHQGTDAFVQAQSIGEQSLPEPAIRQNLARFFAKRPAMQKPSAADIEEIVSDFKLMPGVLVELAFKRIDEVYKPSWKIPPRKEHFHATVAEELRLMTTFKNAQICFEKSLQAYEQRLAARRSPTVSRNSFVSS